MDLITAHNVLSIAAAHRNEGMGTSAESCFIDGIAQIEKGIEAIKAGDKDAAKRYCGNAVRWGIRSLSYSVGICHYRYKTACEVAGVDPNTAHGL